MAKWNAKLITIGNARGIRLPKVPLEKYEWSESLVLEETKDGVLLSGTKINQLSWKETYRAMAVSNEDWSDLDVTVADGLD
ncbi:MAG: AbrB/MazE/SpoVT family DNA-binding domain-containing protein [Gemmatimonadetes bacterium]|nr:AbrB/MazE/SpoVT family DNA-binding domain-containing protein [Gemmatimonadota bacterium]